MVTDPISDYIIRIKNAKNAGAEKVTVPFSRFKLAVGELLVKEGFLRSVQKKGKKVKKVLELEINRDEQGVSRIHDVMRVSRPGRRVYARKKDLQTIHAGRGVVVVSTPQGVLSARDAVRGRLGGEVLFKIW